MIVEKAYQQTLSSNITLTRLIKMSLPLQRPAHLLPSYLRRFNERPFRPVPSWIHNIRTHLQMSFGAEGLGKGNTVICLFQVPAIRLVRENYHKRVGLHRSTTAAPAKYAVRSLLYYHSRLRKLDLERKSDSKSLTNNESSAKLNN